MLTNGPDLAAAFKGFRTIYNTAWDNTTRMSDALAMTVSSTAREEEYGWLSEFPMLREWIGSRVIHKLSKHGFTIKNKLFESTIAVQRTDFEDDRLGIFKPALSEMGRVSKRHKDRLIFELLGTGFDATCFDGQSFFDTDHPVEREGAPGGEVSISNMQDGAGPAWFLMDTSREIRPIIWQERLPYEFQMMTDSNNAHVFKNDEYLYGVRARANAGFGLWQLAYASRAPLTPENYEAARSAMMGNRTSQGTLLGVMPTTLVIPPVLEGPARRILKSSQNEGSSNIWQDTAEIVMSFDLAA